MSTMTNRLTERHDGTGFSFAHPPAAAIEVDPEPTVLESVVIRDADEPVLVAASLAESPLETPDLQVPALHGLVLHGYEGYDGYELRSSGRVPVEGSDAAVLTEITYGGSDPRQALILTARVDGPRLVTLQVHFPPATAEVNRPLALAILQSLAVERRT
jgi:hypothetical protein